MIWALAGPMIVVRSSSDAALICLTVLRPFRSSSRVLGPMPLMSSSSECKARLERLNLREHMEEFGICLQGDVNGRESIKQFVGAMTVVFCQACNGNIEL